jgi:TfoX/Sxy family transcriptional regulator of competence genes
MEWEKPSAELTKLLDSVMTGFPGQKKVMFGAPVYVINGNMFAGVHGKSIFIRLSEGDRREITASVPGTAPFEPVKGHVMKEYVEVPAAVYGSPEVFRKYSGSGFSALWSMLQPWRPRKRKAGGAECGHDGLRKTSVPSPPCTGCATRREW